MQHAERIQRRLREVSGVPDTLAVSFDAFEMIRLLARQFRDQVPELFAAFMTTADAAVDGREAVTAAASLPPPGAGTAEPNGPATAVGLDEVIGVMSVLGTLLADRLTHAAVLATVPDDRAACEEAAAAARRICQLTARRDDGTRLR
jgi:hypothetical protein